MDIGGLETVVANSAYVSARGGPGGASSRDRRQRNRLRLPHISQCHELRARLAGERPPNAPRAPQNGAPTGGKTALSGGKGAQNGGVEAQNGGKTALSGGKGAQNGGVEAQNGGEMAAAEGLAAWEASFRGQCVEQPIGKLLFRQFLSHEEALAAPAALWAGLEELESCERDQRGRLAQQLREKHLEPRGSLPCAFLSPRARAVQVVGGAAGGRRRLRGLPRVGQRRLRRGVRLPAPRHRQDVRQQAPQQEAPQEEERLRGGAGGEADPGAGPQPLRRLLGVRLPDQNRPLPRHDPHERRRPQVPHLQRGRGAPGLRRAPRGLLRSADPAGPRAPPPPPHRLPRPQTRERPPRRPRSRPSVRYGFGGGAEGRREQNPRLRRNPGVYGARGAARRRVRLGRGLLHAGGDALRDAGGQRALPPTGGEGGEQGGDAAHPPRPRQLLGAVQRSGEGHLRGSPGQGRQRPPQLPRQRLRSGEGATALRGDQLGAPRGLVPPPFVPDPRRVYAKDLADVGAFSTVRGVELDATDAAVGDAFASGTVAIPWQEELIETGVFQELNVWGAPGTVPPDLDPSAAPAPGGPRSATCGLL
ncbi:rhodopsin kinase GRK1 isoform X5 [Cuculus canorus]|uniref:rhodopsin kinase GRK1 isoform X5 n=1 Tax=Cuculus canorus TaxID=55661 RepID=UPI0023AAFA7F|nr:rhodopsin kinase GRK1 isoform X5 [Cuculus canorus]